MIRSEASSARSASRGRSAVPPFEIDNRGKRSVVLDLRQPEALEQLHQLLDTADVFVTNVRPAALERLGLESRRRARAAPAARVRQPDGIRAGRARTRSRRVRRRRVLGPQRTRAHHGAARSAPAAVASRHRRSHHGHHTARRHPGQAAGTRAHGATVASWPPACCAPACTRSGWDIGVMLRFGKREGTRPREASRDAAGQLLPISRWPRASGCCCLEADRHWPNLVAALDRADLAADERFVDARSRRRNSADLIAGARRGVRRVVVRRADRAVRRHDVWWAPINSIADVIADPQAIACGCIRRHDATRRRGAVPGSQRPGRLRRLAARAQGRCPRWASTPPRCCANWNRATDGALVRAWAGQNPAPWT